jgi:hypothetical protein
VSIPDTNALCAIDQLGLAEDFNHNITTTRPEVGTNDNEFGFEVLATG